MYAIRSYYETYLGDHTLLHVPNAPSPSRVTLGVLRVPASAAGITPAFSLEQRNNFV